MLFQQSGSFLICVFELLLFGDNMTGWTTLLDLRRQQSNVTLNGSMTSWCDSSVCRAVIEAFMLTSPKHLFIDVKETVL